MEQKNEKFILISGLMGSGKSTLIDEYIYQRDVEEFTKPPVEAKFRGMEFEFVDQIFALTSENIKYNFYELDAPTINKWTQFVQIADAIIIVYNYKKNDYFESPEKFIRTILDNTKKTAPLFFVINNCDNFDDGLEKLKSIFNLSKFDNNLLNFRYIETGEVYFTEEFGPRVNVDIKKLDQLYEDVIASIKQT